MKEHPTHKGYFVATDGRVYSAWKRKGSGLYGSKIEYYTDTDNLKELSQTNNNKGYVYVHIRGKKSKREYVHRLVAQTYLSNNTNLKEVNHINYIRNDNRLENLEWCDRTTNVQHSNYKHRHNTEVMELLVWVYNYMRFVVA